jgi:glycosyltransferase involved in cell wall biosynthesis
VARVTIVVPCFNDGAFVPALVDSVQEDEPVEIVVVDDGSNDGTTVPALQALEAAGRIRLVQQANAGPGAAMNAGTAAATTPYVFFCGADDLLDPRALGRLADALEAAPGAGFALGWLQYFGDLEFVYETPAWNPWVVLYTNKWPGCFLVRRELVAGVGGFRRTGYEDWDLFMALAEHGASGVLVPEVVYHYRKHGAQRTNRTVQGRFREHYRDMQRAHAALFAREPELRRAYGPPLPQQLAYRAQLAIGLALPPRVASAALGAKLALRDVPGRARDALASARRAASRRGS